MHTGRPDRHDRRGGQGVRPVPQGRRARQEHVRPRPAVVDVRPPDRAHHRLPRASGSPRSPTSATPTSPRSRPAGTSARPPRRSPSPTRSSRPRCRRAPTATSPATSRWPTASSPAACSPGCRSSSAPTRSPRPPTSSTSCRKHKALRRHHLPGRGRDRRRRRGARRVVRRRARRHHDLRPGHRAEVRDDRPGRDDRAAAGRRSTSSAAARRPACRPRPSRPTCCRRCSAATARRRCRSSRRSRPATASTPPSRRPGSRVTYRTPVMLLSDGYLANGSEPWRIPEVAELPDHRPELRHRAQPRRRRTARRGVLALPARPGDPGPAVGGPRHARASSTASAASRRATATATSPTTRPTTTSWSAPARPRSTGSPTRCRRSRSTTPPRRRRKVLVLGWGSTYGPIGAGVRRRAQGRLPGRPGPPAPPQPVPEGPRRRAARATTRCWCPR